MKNKNKDNKKASSNPADLLEEESLDLALLKESAPDDFYNRLDRRITTAQLGKDLVEKQVFAAFSVFDAFLRLIFTRKPNLANDTKGENDARNI